MRLLCPKPTRATRRYKSDSKTADRNTGSYLDSRRLTLTERIVASPAPAGHRQVRAWAIFKTHSPAQAQFKTFYRKRSGAELSEVPN